MSDVSEMALWFALSFAALMFLSAWRVSRAWHGFRPHIAWEYAMVAAAIGSAVSGLATAMCLVMRLGWNEDRESTLGLVVFAVGFWACRRAWLLTGIKRALEGTPTVR